MDGKKKLFDEIGKKMDDLKSQIEAMVRAKYNFYPPIKVDEIVNEVLSATLEAAINSADQYDPSRKALPWLMGIAKHKLNDLIRKSVRESKKFSYFEDFLGKTNQWNHEESQIDEQLKGWGFPTGLQREIENRLFEFHDLISSLNKNEQLLMRYIFEKEDSFSEIARIFETSTNAVYTRKSRVIEKIKRQISRD